MRSSVMVVTLLVASGCFNPDDLFPVSGVVESVDPVEGQRVELLRKRRTLFGPCDGPQPFSETRADTEGNYLFELFRASTQVLAGPGNFCFQVQAAFDSGANARVLLEHVDGELQLPPLRDWRAGLNRDGGFVHFAPMQPLPPEDDAGVLVHRLLLLTADGGVAWKFDDLILQEGSVQPRRIELRDDPRLMEEFGGRLTAQARLLGSTELSLEGGLPSLTLFARAAGVLDFTERQQPPWSHRSDCPQVAQPCPLTDHLLVPVELFGAGQVRLELPAPTVPSALVLRGFASPAQSVVVLLTDLDGIDHEYPFSLPVSMYSNDIEVDPSLLLDGGWYYRLRPEPRFALLPLDVDYDVQAVTIRFPGGVERMSELSVYAKP